MRSNSFTQKTTSAAFPPEPRAEEAHCHRRPVPPTEEGAAGGSLALWGGGNPCRARGPGTVICRRVARRAVTRRPVTQNSVTWRSITGRSVTRRLVLVAAPAQVGRKTQGLEDRTTGVSSLKESEEGLRDCGWTSVPSQGAQEQKRRNLAPNSQGDMNIKEAL